MILANFFKRSELRIIRFNNTSPCLFFENSNQTQTLKVRINLFRAITLKNYLDSILTSKVNIFLQYQNIRIQLMDLHHNLESRNKRNN